MIVKNSGVALISRVTLIALFILHPLFILFFYKGHFALVGVGLALVLLTDLLSGKKTLWFDARPKSVYMFFSLPLISFLWARYPGETLLHGSLALVNIAIFYLMMRASTLKTSQAITSLVVVTPLSILAAFLLIYAMYGSIRADSGEMADVVKSFANVGTAIAILCVPYLLLLQSVSTNNRYLILSLVACLFIVLMSGSRGGMLVFVVALFFSVFLAPGKLSSRVTWLIKLGVVIAMIWLVLFLTGMGGGVISSVIDRINESQLFQNNSFQIFDPNRGEGDYVRSLMYAEGINAIREEPVLGLGRGGLAAYIEINHDIRVVSHNIIITAWGEMGIPGLLLLLWLIYSVIFGLWKSLKSRIVSRQDKVLAAATLSAIIAALVHAQFRPLLTNPMFPVLLGVAFTLIRSRRNLVYMHRERLA